MSPAAPLAMAHVVSAPAAKDQLPSPVGESVVEQSIDSGRADPAPPRIELLAYAAGGAAAPACQQPRIAPMTTMPTSR